MSPIGYLNSLRDLDYQEQCWVNQNCPSNVEYDDFDAAEYSDCQLITLKLGLDL